MEKPQLDLFFFFFFGVSWVEILYIHLSYQCPSTGHEEMRYSQILEKFKETDIKLNCTQSLIFQHTLNILVCLPDLTVPGTKSTMKSQYATAATWPGHLSPKPWLPSLCCLLRATELAPKVTKAHLTWLKDTCSYVSMGYHQIHFLMTTSHSYQTV